MVSPPGQYHKSSTLFNYDKLCIFSGSRRRWAFIVYIYSFSRRFCPKRLTIEEYNKRYIIKRQTDSGVLVIQMSRHCSEQILARRWEFKGMRAKLRKEREGFFSSSSLFAEERALWKRGRNINHIKGKIQEAIEEVETWSCAWGVRFSVDKTKTIRTGFAFSIPSLNIVNRRTSDNLSIYTVEMMAIATALQWIEETQIKKVIICTDSCSALK